MNLKSNKFFNYNLLLSDLNFGYYLAGLIDGYFSKKQLVIAFSSPDLILAEYLKNRLNSGNIYPVKNKNAFTYIVSKKESLEFILYLINGKLRKQSKLDQINNNILNQFQSPFNNSIISLSSSEDLSNFWLAGFSDADASFQIKIIRRESRPRPEIRLNFQVDQKERLLLDNINNYFGGYIGHRQSQDTYYYGSTNFTAAKKVINYFDTYPLYSSKYFNYLKWRQVYTLIEQKLHLTEEGLNQILEIKNSMNSNATYII
jgi:hypothetical protein